MGLHDLDRGHLALADETRQLVRGQKAKIDRRQNSPLYSLRSIAF
jgi:hypothetical protein